MLNNMKSYQRICCCLFQVLYLVLYTIFVKVGSKDIEDGFQPHIGTQIEKNYNTITDLRIVILLSFALQLSIYKNNLISGVIYTLICYCFVFQTAILSNSLYENLIFNEWKNIYLNLYIIKEIQYAILAMIISMYSFFGRISLFQLIIYLFIGTNIYSINMNILKFLKIIDNGFTNQILLFGSLFGLVNNYFINQNVSLNNNNGKNLLTIYFNLFGVILLLIYFPMINSSNNLSYQDKANSIINTIFCTCISIFINIVTVSNYNLTSIKHTIIISSVLVSNISGLTLNIAILFLISLVCGVFMYKTTNKSNKINYSNTINYYIAFCSIISIIMYIIILSVISTENLSYEFKYNNKKDQILHNLFGLLSTIAISVVGGIICGNITNYYYDEELLYKDNFVLDIDPEVRPMINHNHIHHNHINHNIQQQMHMQRFNNITPRNTYKLRNRVSPSSTETNFSPNREEIKTFNIEEGNNSAFQDSPV